LAIGEAVEKVGAVERELDVAAVVVAARGRHPVRAPALLVEIAQDLPVHQVVLARHVPRVDRGPPGLRVLKIDRNLGRM